MINYWGTATDPKQPVADRMLVRVFVPQGHPLIYGRQHVMREWSICFLSSLLLTGCAVSPYKTCDSIIGSSDVLLEKPPANQEEFISLLEPSEWIQGDMRTFLSRRKTAWFVDTGDGGITLCSYVVSKHACGNDIHVANFRFANSHWKTYGLSPEICFADPRVN